MRKYTDNEHLVNYVNQNDVESFKDELLRSIIFLRGNKEEINKAIDFAVQNSSFAFDTHKEIEVDNNLSFEDIYAIESINMQENYSRERFEKLIDIYTNHYSKKEYTYETEPETDNNKVAKVVVVGVAVAIAVYALYKILD